jgi:D-serine deaminase-like pyridoxal phosphate-dependent protein
MANTPRNWFTLTEPNELNTPALLVYPERIKYNLNLLKSMIDDVTRLRPHVKTHKCPEVVLLTMAAGIQKFKCATIAEAEMLGICQAKDVLLAYQPIGPKINRFIKLIKAYPLTLFSCLVDNEQSAQNIALHALNAGLQIDVYIDLNVGMNRTGIAPGQEALQLYLDCAAKNGMNPVGLHAYDGHIRDTDLKIRTTRCDAWFLVVEKLQQDIKKKGHPEPIIIAGGTPTYSVHCKRKKVECSPGTFIYMDEGYGSAFNDIAFLQAAMIATRIISRPDETKLCLDVGHKSVAAENPLDKRVFFLDARDLEPISQSEEHLVVEAMKGHLYKVGEVLYGLPYHICPTVALYEKVYTVENYEVTGKWRNIARDREINI